MNDPKDIELLADIEHLNWSKWTDHMLNKLRDEVKERFGDGGRLEFDGLPSVQRWRRQMAAPYAELSETEKESDRNVAREKILAYRGKTQLYRASAELLVWKPSLVLGAEPELLTVTNRKWGGFSCPGGKVEPGESLVDAARRELKEETGCDAISLEPFIGGVHWDDPKDNGFPWFCMSFFVDIGDQVPTKQEEGTEIGWHTPTQLMAESIYPDWYRYLFSQSEMK